MLAQYFAKKGKKEGGQQEAFEDKSENLNIGLINYKNDSEVSPLSQTWTNFIGLTYWNV